MASQDNPADSPATSERIENVTGSVADVALGKQL